MDKQKSIEALQFFVTNLNAQSFQHKLQAKIFGSIGYKKLEAKYLEHAEEEQGFVNQFIDRFAGNSRRRSAKGTSIRCDAIL